MDIKDLKILLLEEPYKVVNFRQQSFIPILHNKDLVILQFTGWSINLKSDGSYIIEATDGG